jgi:GT2 family glycosyltransferase/glycosyltransferase involved in cell wall biosynthesis
MFQSIRGHVASGLDSAMWAGLRLAARLRPRRSGLAQLLRRSVLLVWWTLTGQLRMQFRAWCRARRLRAAAPRAPDFSLVDDTEASRITLPVSDRPVVSVIIPTYGQVAFTRRCLASIAEHPPETPIEVIVVDDAFPGPETAELGQVTGVRLLRNETNIGFIGSCNNAARAAQGTYLLFLNNDTQVLADWLEPMLALFHNRSDTGAVGSKLLYPDGRLQEAGGIIWQDGSGWNFGRLDDPDAPVYNYVREVDYCSGAALLVRRDVFLGLDGFDRRYAPAYFEDADLSFRLRAQGLRTLYQPRSRVVHHEGTSHGTDLAVGVKSFQVRNRKTFVGVWADTLGRDHFANGQSVLRARDRARHRPVVLVIDHYVPQPDRDAGSRTMLAFMHALLGAGWIVKFWPHNLCHLPGYSEALQDLGIEVFHGSDHPDLDAWLKANGSQLDHVLLSRPDVAEDCLPALRSHTQARIAYYGHDLHFRRMRLQGEHRRNEAELRAADRMEERERAVWRAVDAVLYPSEEEARMVKAMVPDVTARAVLPYGFDHFIVDRPVSADRLILFVAGFAHPPNEEAAIWFADSILPLVRARVPDARLAIVGSSPTARVRALAGDGVRIQADVTDAELAAWYGRARVAAVPLLFGAGVKLKVVEAMVRGLPLVTTPVGAQGLPDVEAIVAVTRDPARFAASVIELLLDDAAWRRQAAAQTHYAEARFSTRALAASLLGAMQASASADAAVASL